MGLINGLKMLKAFVLLIKDPQQTEHVFALSDLAHEAKGPLYEETRSYILALPGFQGLFKESYDPPLPSIAELQKYPEASFGHALAKYFILNKLDPDFYPERGDGTIEDYVMDRGRKSHDLWHVVSGLPTSVPGEVGLQAFTLAQLRSPFSAVVIAGGILHSLVVEPRIFNTTVDFLFRGWELGKACQPLLGFRLEDRLTQNLVELRQELGLHI